MSNIIQKFLLAGDQKKNTKTQIEDLKFIYINERDKLCFQHDVVYKHFKDIPRRNMSKKDYVIGHSQLLVSKIMMKLNPNLHQWSKNLLITRLEKLTQERELLRLRNWPMNYINLLLKSFSTASFTHFIDTVLGLVILHMCS